ncbi:VOC family protein [Aeromicrobium massiliense]|uniref:VOC family protein n=1 Tax=Aeromicrobium massiliense TaxID=1464554 RepID=UPI00030AA35F|nr:VOC family protein [Aeromicrobium massiliense]
MSLVTFQALCVDVNDLHVGGLFYSRILGVQTARPDLDPDDVKLVGPTAEHTVWPNKVLEPKTVKNRVHLDVWGRSVEDFRDLQQLTEDGHFPWTVFAGPEGDEFCVFEWNRDEELPEYRLKDVVVDAVDHVAISRWWADVMGGTLTHDDSGYSYLDDAPGVPFESFDFVPVPEPKTTKNRIHWDVDLVEGATIADLVAKGATVLREKGGDIHWTVMADPEGNEFCVFDD